MKLDYRFMLSLPYIIIVVTPVDDRRSLNLHINRNMKAQNGMMLTDF
jgi:hypothetical protein